MRNASWLPIGLPSCFEARWRAFGGASERPKASVPVVYAARRPDETTAASALAGRRVVAAGSPPKPISWWEGVKIVLPLIGIIAAGSNLLGLWATQEQVAAHERRREWQQGNARYEAERKELDEKLRRQREELDEFWRNFRWRPFFRSD